MNWIIGALPLDSLIMEQFFGAKSNYFADMDIKNSEGNTCVVVFALYGIVDSLPMLDAAGKTQGCHRTWKTSLEL